MVCSSGILTLRAEDFSASLSRNDDGRIFLTFPTMPVYFYAVETSTDGVTFSAESGGLYYGNGATVHHFILQGPPTMSSGSPVGSPPNWGNLPQKDFHFVSAFLYLPAVSTFSATIERFDATATPDSWRSVIYRSFPQGQPGSTKIVTFSVEDPDARYDFFLTVTWLTDSQYGALSAAPSPRSQRHVRGAKILNESAERILGDLVRPVSETESTPTSQPKENISG